MKSFKIFAALIGLMFCVGTILQAQTEDVPHHESQVDVVDTPCFTMAITQNFTHPTKTYYDITVTNKKNYSFIVLDYLGNYEVCPGNATRFYRWRYDREQCDNRIVFIDCIPSSNGWCM